MPREFDSAAYFSNLANKSVSKRTNSLAQATQSKSADLAKMRDQKSKEINGAVASWGVGSNRLLEGVGTLIGIATGDMQNAVRLQGQSGAEYYQDRKPGTLTAKEEARHAAVAQANGEVQKFGTAIWETIQDPELFGSFLTEQLPNFIPGGAVGRVAGAVGGATAATAGALGTGSAIHAADVVGGVYDDLKALPQSVWDANIEFSERVAGGEDSEQVKEDLAQAQAAKAGVWAAGSSLVTQLLPGGATIEKALAGSKKAVGSVVGGAVKGAVGETVQEALEEGSGAISGNIAKQAIDPTQDTFENVGENAGLGALGGGTIGAIAGATGGVKEKAVKKLVAQQAEQAENADMSQRISEAASSGNYTGFTEGDKSELGLAAFAAGQRAQLSDDPVVQETAKKEVHEFAKQQRERVASMEAELEAAEVDKKPALKKALEEEIQQTTVAELAVQTITEQARPEKAKIEETVEAVKSEEPGPERDAANAEAIKLMMSDTKAFTDDQIIDMEKNGSFNDEEREVMATFSKANAAVNEATTIEGVRDIVANGKSGFKGFKEYGEQVAQAVAANDEAGMETQMESLRTFAESHKGKYNAMVKAKEQAEAKSAKTGKNASWYFYRDANAPTGWVTTEKQPWTVRALPGPDRGEIGAGFINTSPNGVAASDKYMGAVRTELEAIIAMGQQFSAIQEQVFNSPTQEETFTDEEIPVEEAVTPVEVKAEEKEVAKKAAKPAQQEAATAEAVTPVAESEPAKPAAKQPAPPVQETLRTQSEPSTEREQAPVVDTEQTEQLDGPPVDDEDPGAGIDDAPEATEDEVAAALEQARLKRAGEFLSGPEAVVESTEDELTTAILREAALTEGILPQVDTDKQTSERQTTEEFTTDNQISRSFTQSNSDAEGGTPNPLVSIKNFMGKFFVKTGATTGNFNSALTKKFIGKRDHTNEIKASQLKLLAHFAGFESDFGKLVDKQYKTPKEGGDAFQYENFMGYFADENGQLSENVKTAIAYAAYAHIQDKGNKFNRTNDADAIRAILGKPDSYVVTEDDKKLLGLVGTRRNIIVGELGQTVAAALGLRAVKGAPANMQVQMELALGATALTAMLEMTSLIEVTEVQSNLLSEGDRPDKATTPFIAFKRDEEGEPVSATAKAILDVTPNTKSILSKLFSVEPALKAPEEKPGVYNQKSVNKTKRGVPEKLHAILKRISKREHFIRQDMRKLRGHLEPQINQAIAGFSFDTYSHRELELANMAKNDAVLRELAHLNEFESDIEERPFYLTPVMWQPQRVGYKQNMINPQQSKVQRHNISMKGWQTTFKLKGDPVMTDRFKLAVAQGLGIDVDKQINETSMLDLETELNKPEIIAAIFAIQKAEALAPGEFLGRPDQLAIANAAGSMHALDALVSYSAYLSALDALSDPSSSKPSKTFTTEILFEVDGVTNGPALSKVMLGAAKNVGTAMFGMFNQAEAEQYGHSTKWKEEAGNEDMYVSLERTISDSVAPDSMQYHTDVMELVGNKRNFVKEPATKLTFGASTHSIIKAMKESLVHGSTNYPGWYEQLQEAANLDAKTEGPNVHVEIVVAKLNALLPKTKKFKVTIDGQEYYRPYQVPQFETLEDAMDYKLDLKQEKELEYLFSKHVAPAVSAGLNKEFAEFIDARNALNESAQAAWFRYDAAFNHAKDLILAENPGATTKTGLILQDLSTAELESIYKSLEAIAPIAHTAMSTGGDINNGFSFESVHRQLAFEDKSRQQIVEFSGKTKQMGVAGRKTVSSDPGVRAIVLLVHALDSAISHSAMGTDIESGAAMNIHDAHLLGLENMLSGAEALNKQTYQQMLNYSLPLSIHQALENSFTGLASLEETYPGISDVVGAAEMPIRLGQERPYAFEGVEDEDGNTQTFIQITEDFLADQKAIAVEAEIGKLESLTEMYVVDQYAQEGGSYAVTDEDRATAQEKLETLRGQEYAQDQVSDAQSAPLFTKDGILPTYVIGRPAPEETPWGLVGESSRVSDAAITAALEADENMTVRKMIPILVKSIKANSPDAITAKFRMGLLQQIAKTVDLEMPIKLIQPDTTVVGNEAEGTNLGLGWYHKGVIRVKSPAFVNSGISAELLLHEMTHGGLTKNIHRLRNVPKNKVHPNDMSAWEGTQELIALNDLARKYVEDNGLMDQFGAATSDVQELVAWGMTNSNFQLQVMAKLTMPSTASQRSQESGIRGFIRGMVKVLFGAKANLAAENGMGIMIANTGLLFENTQNVQQALADVDTKNFMATTDPMAYTSEQIFDGLGRTNSRNLNDPGFIEHLKSVLATTVRAAYGTSGAIRAAALRQAPTTAEDVYLQSMVEGRLPFASELQAALQVTDQEAMVLESVEVTVRESINSSTMARKELQAAFKQASEEITVEDLLDGDWATASKVDQDIATAAHIAIFKVQDTGAESDYLSRFAAATLAYKPLNEAMQKLDVPADNKRFGGQPLATKINMILEILSNIISRLVTKTVQGQRLDKAVHQLSISMARIEAKKAATLKRRQDRAENVFAKAGEKVADGVRDTVLKAANSRMIKNSRFAAVELTGTISRVVAGEKVEGFMDELKRMRDGEINGRLGVLGEIINEMRNGREDLHLANKLLDMANLHEQTRKHVMMETKKYVEESFDRVMSERELRSLTEVLVKTDLSVFHGDLSSAEIEMLISNEGVRDAKIAALEASLAGPDQFYYIRQAKDLGWFMTTGENKSPNLMLNAYNIALKANTKRQGAPDNLPQTRATIDQLTSLYALKATGRAARSAVADLARSEMGRSDGGNGVDTLLRMHLGMKQEAAENTFKDNKFQMIKGYTKEIMNPHISVLMATAEEGVQLKEAGYTLVDGQPLSQDPTAVDTEAKFMWAVRDGGLNPTVSGFMPMVNRSIKGTAVHNGVYDNNGKANPYNQRDNNAIEAARGTLVDDMFTTDPSAYDPRSEEVPNYMAPVINNYGKAANYRYMMTEATKRRVMDSNTRVDDIMGHLAASTLDKERSPAMSRTGVDAMKAVFDTKFVEDTNAFIDFSEDSTDPKVRERFRLLPDDTKKYIREVWGRDGMWVRNDMYNIAFGYRKYSIGEAFEKDSAERNGLEKVVVGLLERVPVGWDYENNQPKVLGKKAALKAVQAEDMWQEVVKEVKDIWVIKNLWTLIGNESSNFTVLLLAGVPIQDIVKNKILAYSATMTYQNNRKERDKLQRGLDLGLLQVPDGQNKVISAKAATTRIAALNDALARSPVADLVEAGMFQTLVEDIGQEQDDYSYKSKMTRWIDEHTYADSENTGVQVARDVGKNLVMTHDSGFYKLLNSATIFSDFTSRYVMHQHMINRAKNPLSKEESLRFARAAFVNYDVPTHKGLQYLNDTGLLWFTKYYLRIQVVLAQIVKENPTGALALLGLQDQFGNVSDILDSSMLTKWPGNVGMGAAEIFGAIPEIATIQAVSAAVD